MGREWDGLFMETYGLITYYRIQLIVFICQRFLIKSDVLPWFDRITAVHLRGLNISRYALPLAIIPIICIDISSGEPFMSFNIHC